MGVFREFARETEALKSELQCCVQYRVIFRRDVSRVYTESPNTSITNRFSKSKEKMQDCEIILRKYNINAQWILDVDLLWIYHQLLINHVFHFDGAVKERRNSIADYVFLALTHRFSPILQSCISDTRAIVWLRNSQWSRPDGYGWKMCQTRADSRLAPSQWELQSNAVSDWIGANL